MSDGYFLGRSYDTYYGWQIGSVEGMGMVEVTYNYHAASKRVEITHVVAWDAEDTEKVNIMPLLGRLDEDALCAAIQQYEIERTEE